MDVLENVFRLYMPDTNCFRYASSILQKTDKENDEQSNRRLYKNAATSFWNKVILESERKEAKILVSSEVIQELKVQSYTLDKKENKSIMRLLSKLEEELESTVIPQEVEFSLREFSNYSRKNFGNLLTPPGRKMEYLRTSDARIFIHAYLNDAIIATANIKDFLLYPLFFEAEEDKLYDILSSSYVHVNQEGRMKIQQDKMYQQLLTSMRDLKY